MTAPLRAALVGLGNIAWRFGSHAEAGSLSHAAAYQANPRTVLAGGMDIDGDARGDFQKATGRPAFATLPEMLKALRPEVVSICSPQALHTEHALGCIAAGVRMLWLEKPLAETLAEAEALAEAALRTGCTVLVGYQRRYMGCYRRLRQAFTAERLGPCRGIEMRYSRGLAPNGSHMLDLLLFLLGENAPLRLEHVEGGAGPNPGFSFRLSAGPAIAFSGLDLPYHDIDAVLTCDNGRMAVLHGGMDTLVEERAEQELFPGFFRLRAAKEDFLAPGGFDRAMDRALDDLLEAHAHRREPVSSLRTALASHRLLEAVLAEARA